MAAPLYDLTADINSTFVFELIEKDSSGVVIDYSSGFGARFVINSTYTTVPDIFDKSTPATEIVLSDGVATGGVNIAVTIPSSLTKDWPVLSNARYELQTWSLADPTDQKTTLKGNINIRQGII